MAKRNKGLLDLLVDSPWWVSCIFAASFYTLFNNIIPDIKFSNQLVGMVLNGVSSQVGFITFVLLLPAPVSYFRFRNKARLLDKQKSIDSIKQLSWKEFEYLIGEYYRRLGYKVIENHGSGADGGVDVKLIKDRQITLVQCKQYRNSKVGVAVVREMFGIMTAENADDVIIVSSGMFTNDAKAFSQNKAIKLVNGEQLLGMISSVQNFPDTLKPEQNVAEEPEDKVCPKCGALLVTRIAKKGTNAGNQFIGCSAFPKCRYTK